MVFLFRTFSALITWLCPLEIANLVLPWLRDVICGSHLSKEAIVSAPLGDLPISRVRPRESSQLLASKAHPSWRCCLIPGSHPMDAPGHDLSNLVVSLKARSTQGPCNLDTWSDAWDFTRKNSEMTWILNLESETKSCSVPFATTNPCGLRLKARMVMGTHYCNQAPGIADAPVFICSV